MVKVYQCPCFFSRVHMHYTVFLSIEAYPSHRNLCTVDRFAGYGKGIENLDLWTHSFCV